MRSSTWAVISRWSGETVEQFLDEPSAAALRLGADDFSVVECDHYGNPL